MKCQQGEHSVLVVHGNGCYWVLLPHYPHTELNTGTLCLQEGEWDLSVCTMQAKRKSIGRLT